jgi:hypothetical protein
MVTQENTSQLVIYQTEDGNTKLDVRFQDETVWLTQKLMAELFQTSKQNVGQHLQNIFNEGELLENSVVKDFFTTGADGKNYRTKHYNLDAIISIGYRITPPVWITTRRRTSASASSRRCRTRFTGRLQARRQRKSSTTAPTAASMTWG